MGMYTELVLKIEVDKEKTPKDVMNVLRFLFSNRKLITDLPEHDFFKCSRWKMIGSCNSFYHHPAAVNSWVELEYSDIITIFSRSDLKDYGNEIELFLDWIDEYLDILEDDCIGWKWYEGDYQPTLLFKQTKR